MKSGIERVFRVARRVKSRLSRLIAPRPRYRSSHSDREIVNQFHRLYFHSRQFDGIDDYWLGVKIIKYPTDLMAYQEIISEIRPAVIIETGTHSGGSALFFAGLCDLLGRGRVVSIDIDTPPAVSHPRISFVTGDSTNLRTVARVGELVAGEEPVLVTLDSRHIKEHVLEEMKLYAAMTTVGSYLVVEDTKLNGHPVFTPHRPDQGEGPMEAVQEFLKTHKEFVVDRSREKYLLTSQPGGSRP